MRRPRVRNAVSRRRWHERLRATNSVSSKISGVGQERDRRAGLLRSSPTTSHVALRARRGRTPGGRPCRRARPRRRATRRARSRPRRRRRAGRRRPCSRSPPNLPPAWSFVSTTVERRAAPCSSIDVDRDAAAAVADRDRVVGVDRRPRSSRCGPRAPRRRRCRRPRRRGGGGRAEPVEPMYMPGPQPDRLEALEDRDVLGRVGPSALVFAIEEKPCKTRGFAGVSTVYQTGRS